MAVTKGQDEETITSVNRLEPAHQPSVQVVVVRKKLPYAIRIVAFP
jgi:hypothetical protein